MSMSFSETMKDKLPIFKARSEIIETFKDSETIIYVGETGTGKTTQIPQYLLHAGYAKHKCIAVSEPRRVAAITLAERVANEQNTELGSKVGYSVRFENMSSAATKIKFLTDGMLLRESIANPLFLEYSVVILDEAHERTLFNDLLMGLVKDAQRERREKNLLPLKIIVMSATLQANHISQYFNNAPVYQIFGRPYAIQIYHAQKVDNHVHDALVTVFKIHRNEDKGDILVFCSGQEEIDEFVAVTRSTADSLTSRKVPPIIAYPLYGALPYEEQMEVFKASSLGTRKVIFATNIAETSITIPNIKYVVDTGKVKTKSYNPSCGFDLLHVEFVSKAQAKQRAGRAGRECNGKCFCLYTKETHDNFEEHAKPEILRCSLSNALLQMIAIGVSNVAEFDFIDKPPKENIDAAVRLLMNLEAIVCSNGHLKLTDCGSKMVKFPLDPMFSKMIISSVKYRCTDEILSIISMLSVENIFCVTRLQRDKANEARKKFEAPEGDHIMLLNIYKQFKKCNQSEWCKENYINFRSMRLAIKIRGQLRSICESVGIPPCSCQSTVDIRKCLVSGLFLNAARLSENNTYKVFQTKQEVFTHPSSCLHNKKNLGCVIFTELTQTAKVYMRNVTYVPEEMLYNVVPKYFKEKPGYQVSMKPIIFIS